MSQVIAIAGGIGSGKSTIARALADYFKCPIASFGDYVRGVAELRGREANRRELQEIGEQLLPIGKLGQLARN